MFGYIVAEFYNVGFAFDRFLSAGICTHECDYLSVTTPRRYPYLTRGPIVRHHESIPPEYHHRVVVPTTPSVTHSRADEWAEVDIPSQAPVETLKDMSDVVVVFADDKEREDEAPGLRVDEVPTVPDHYMRDTPMDELEILPSTPYHHVPQVPGRPESWMGTVSSPVHTEALPTEGVVIRYEVTVEDNHKRAQKEEAPVDYVHEDFEDSEDSSSGALTNAAPAMFTESLLMPPHLSPTPSQGNCGTFPFKWVYEFGVLFRICVYHISPEKALADV